MSRCSHRSAGGSRTSCYEFPDSSRPVRAVYRRSRDWRSSRGPPGRADTEHAVLVTGRAVPRLLATNTRVLRSDRIFLVAADASSASRQQFGPDRDAAAPVFSPDGRRIAFLLLIRSDALTLAVMDADGSNVRELVSFPVIGGSMQHGGTGFAWSPDGTTCCLSTAVLRTTTLTCTRSRSMPPRPTGDPVVRQITSTPLLEYGASWSADGNRIAYLHGPNAGLPGRGGIPPGRKRRRRHQRVCRDDVALTALVAGLEACRRDDPWSRVPRSC